MGVVFSEGGAPCLTVLVANAVLSALSMLIFGTVLMVFIGPLCTLLKGLLCTLKPGWMEGVRTTAGCLGMAGASSWTGRGSSSSSATARLSSGSSTG